MATDEFILGGRDRISLAIESTYADGGTPGDGEVIGINATMDPDFNQNWQEVISAGAASRAVESFEQGPIDYPYVLSFTPVNWRWLKYLLNVADAGAGPYTHTFTIANTLNTFGIEWARRKSGTSHVLTGVGGFMKEATIAFNKPSGPGRDGFIQVTAQCNAQDFTDGTSVTSLSALTDKGFKFHHVKFTLDGTEVTEVNNGEITISNGIQEAESRYANSTNGRKISQPIPQTFRISGRINVTVKDNTYWTKWETGAAITGTNKLEFIRGANDDLVITFGDIYIASPGEGATNLDGTTTLDIVFQAAGFTSIVATDDIASY